MPWFVWFCFLTAPPKSIRRREFYSVEDKGVYSKHGTTGVCTVRRDDGLKLR